MKKDVLKHVINLTNVFTVAFGFLLIDPGQLLAGDGSLVSEETSKDLSPREVYLGFLPEKDRKDQQGTVGKKIDVLVSGTVTDISGEPIPGVTVSVPGTTIGTATDLNGKYSLNV